MIRTFKEKVLTKKRYLIAVLTSFGLFISFAMRCEFGIAIIRMSVNTTFHKPTFEIKESFQEEITKSGNESWTHTQKSFILAAFYIGYATFSIPSGFMTTVFSPNAMFGFSILLSATLNLTIPFLVSLPQGFYFVFVVRLCQGISESSLYPTIHNLWKHWAPRQERSKLVTISFFGMAMGPVLGYPVSGILTEKFHWSLPFYVWSFVSFIWLIFWLTLVRSSPENDTFITKSERNYIVSTTSRSTVNSADVPWKAIFSSKPVWAIVVANISRNWSHQFAFTGLPTFLNTKFHVSMTNLGFHMSSPYLVMALLAPIGGAIADYLISKKVSITLVRRIFNSVGFGVGGICFLFLGFAPSLWISSLLITIGLGFFGIGLSGYAVNHLDIADLFAGVLMGISNGHGSLAGGLSPIVASFITQKYPGDLGWTIHFVTSGFIHLSSVLFYGFFSSGEMQHWNKTSVKPKKEDDISLINKS